MTIATYSQQKVWLLYGIREKTGDSIYYQPFKKNSAWFKTIFKKPITVVGQKAISSVKLYVFNCADEKIAKQSSGYYNEEGSVFDYEQKSDYYANNNGMEYPFPETQELEFLIFFCKYVSK
jgi:hypothetical protein